LTVMHIARIASSRWPRPPLSASAPVNPPVTRGCVTLREVGRSRLGKPKSGEGQVTKEGIFQGASPSMPLELSVFEYGFPTVLETLPPPNAGRGGVQDHHDHECRSRGQQQSIQQSTIDQSDCVLVGIGGTNTWPPLGGFGYLLGRLNKMYRGGVGLEWLGGGAWPPGPPPAPRSAPGRSGAPHRGPHAAPSPAGDRRKPVT